MKKQKKPLNSVALLFFMIIAAGVLTYLIPAGSYQRTEVAGRMVVDPDSFTWIESSPTRLLDVFVAVPSGMMEAANLLAPVEYLTCQCLPARQNFPGFFLLRHTSI